MKTLKKGIYGASAAVAALVLLTGCGGSGNGVNFPSNFAGTWSGTWSSTAIPPGPASNSGPVTIQITKNGNVSGSTTLAPSGVHESISGTISNQGAFTGTITAGTTVIQCSGTGALNTSASPVTLAMTLTEGSPIATGTDSLSLTKT